MMKAFLVLLCEGHQLDGFNFCSGVENTMLDLEKAEATSNYISLIKYLDSVTKLFEGPCVNMNVISNTIYKIYEMGYITEKVFNYFSHFWGMHKRCGLILTILVKE